MCFGSCLCPCADLTHPAVCAPIMSCVRVRRLVNGIAWPVQFSCGAQQVHGRVWRGTGGERHQGFWRRQACFATLPLPLPPFESERSRAIGTQVLLRSTACRAAQLTVMRLVCRHIVELWRDGAHGAGARKAAALRPVCETAEDELQGAQRALPSIAASMQWGSSQHCDRMP